MTDMVYVVAFPLVSYCKRREMFNTVNQGAGIIGQYKNALLLVNTATVKDKCSIKPEMFWLLFTCSL